MPDRPGHAARPQSGRRPVPSLRHLLTLSEEHPTPSCDTSPLRSPNSCMNFSFFFCFVTRRRRPPSRPAAPAAPAPAPAAPGPRRVLLPSRACAPVPGCVQLLTSPVDTHPSFSFMFAPLRPSASHSVTSVRVGRALPRTRPQARHRHRGLLQAMFASSIPEIIELVGSRSKYSGELKREHGKRYQIDVI